jgi:hypothetical protein
MAWIETFDAFFFITLGGLLLAAFKYGVEYCLKSKCSEFQLCCIRIKRDVRVEAEIEQATLEARANGVVIPEPDHSIPALPSPPKRRATA